MRQVSLLAPGIAALAHVMPDVRAAMRQIAGSRESEGRKALVDKLNQIASEAEIKLTGGNSKSISKDLLDKWLSPSDSSHPPSLLAILAFCRATDNPAPLQIILRAVGLDVMTDEDRKFRDYGRAVWEAEEAARNRKRIRERI
ncbi:MAG TPA: hypothetical protein H9991_06005 [Candidatus Mailhella excrementigallinarum]|nr:hypothetical protein [Candidatus Mailhella excrementigallinarum]